MKLKLITRINFKVKTLLWYTCISHLFHHSQNTQTVNIPQFTVNIIYTDNSIGFFRYYSNCISTDYKQI